MAHLRKQSPQLALRSEDNCNSSDDLTVYKRGACPALAIIAIVATLVLSCEPVVKVTAPFLRLVALLGFVGVLSSAVAAQQNDSAKPVVVQPGAPGKPSKTLPPSTKATLPARSQADVEFMQGMIMHHAQAIEMTALIDSNTDNKDLHSLGARISRSQSDEIKFMQRWLAVRGEPVSMSPQKMPGHAYMDQHMDMSHESMHLMPGMLTSGQMEALRKARGADFDRLFLTGMIQHHNGALTMVKDLFDTAGAGQDAELFNFATDVDTGQRAEIRIMQEMLERNPLAQMKEEKR
jgi:uncharacterized protein (DUF305 family)